MARSAAINTHNGLSRTNHRRSLPDVRVVAGDLRGRRIEAPVTDATRPTTDKVREAVFNALGSLGVIEGARIVDLFAGTGAMGIEALSRGAAHCVFVERDRDALVVLKKNISALGLSDRASVLAIDAMTAASRQPDIDLIIADPPYGFTQWQDLIIDAQASVVVLESDRAVGALEGWNTIREKKYGRTHVAFLQPADAPDGTVEGE